MQLRTTAADVGSVFFDRSPKAAAMFDAWKADPRRALVAPAVLGVEITVPYRITPEDVRRVCATTDHALGKADRRTAEGVESIRDWHPDFAFAHTLAMATEELGLVPTYQEFRDYLLNTANGLERLGSPAIRAMDDAVAHGHSVEAAKHAMRWRVGNAYYAYLKELYLVTLLRDLGHDARTHPLADALLRVDCWVGDVLVSLYVGNTFYRSGDRGRKVPSHEILGDAKPKFDFRELELPTPHKFGVVKLPDADEVAAWAGKNLRSGAR